MSRRTCTHGDQPQALCSSALLYEDRVTRTPNAASLADHIMQAAHDRAAVNASMPRSFPRTWLWQGM